jgi:putative sterol carrier protein
MKKQGTVYKGPAKPKADVTIILSDDTLTDLASGKVWCALWGSRGLTDCAS